MADSARPLPDAPAGASPAPRVRTRLWRPDAAVTEGVWALAEVRVNGAPHAVMMVTPSDLEDFAIGFALTEAIVGDAAAIEQVSLSTETDGLVAALAISEAALADGIERGRGLAGRSGCGVCGVTALGDAVRAPKPASVSSPTTLALDCARQAGIKLAAAGPDGAVVLID